MLHYPKGHYCDVTMIKLLLFHGIRADLRGSPRTVLVGRQSINYLLDFKVICRIFPWNNSLYIIVRKCRLGRVLWVINKCSGLPPSDTLSSFCLAWRRHVRTSKQLFVKSHELPFQSVTVIISTDVCFYWIKGILCGYAQRSVRHPSGSQQPPGRPQIGMSNWLYRVTTKYSYYIR